MLNELIEFKHYTTFLKDSIEGEFVESKRITNDNINQGGNVFKRTLLILARGYLFHDKALNEIGFSFLPLEERLKRVEYALRAMKAWSSVNIDDLQTFIDDLQKGNPLFGEINKKIIEELKTNSHPYHKNTSKVFFIDEAQEFPELIDSRGNGLFLRYLEKNVLYKIAESQKDLGKSNNDGNSDNQSKGLSLNNSILLTLMKWAIAKVPNYDQEFYSTFKHFGSQWEYDFYTFDSILGEAVRLGPLKNFGVAIKIESFPQWEYLNKINKESRNEPVSKVSFSTFLVLASYLKMMSERYNLPYVPVSYYEIRPWLGSKKIFESNNDPDKTLSNYLKGDEIPPFIERNQYSQTCITMTLSKQISDLLCLYEIGKDPKPEGAILYIEDNKGYFDEEKYQIKDDFNKGYLVYRQKTDKEFKYSKKRK